MLMSRMLRLKLSLLIVLAAVIAAEPVIHSHPLVPDNAAVQSLCAVCASGPARLSIGAPTVAAPTVVLYAIDTHPTAAPAEAPAFGCDSRGPPATA
jgi:hypothetical protein